MKRRTRTRGMWGVSLCFIIIMVLAGCAGSGSVVYRPVIHPDMTYAAAVQDLQNAASSGKFHETTGAWTPVRRITSITVEENGISRWEFEPEPRRYRSVEMSLVTPERDFAVSELGPGWIITFPHFMITGSLPELKKAADNLYFIRKSLENLTEKQNKELALFDPVAAEYRSMQTKPPVSEEQRKYIVQANAASQQKAYRKALDLYLKAVTVDPVSYPAAYFNMALLSEQMKWFNSAIFYMKQYLLLVPDAKDARSAQDKIYEWEMQIKK